MKVLLFGLLVAWVLLSIGATVLFSLFLSGTHIWDDEEDEQ